MSMTEASRARSENTVRTSLNASLHTSKSSGMWIAWECKERRRKRRKYFEERGKQNRGTQFFSGETTEANPRFEAPKHVFLKSMRREKKRIHQALRCLKRFGEDDSSTEERSTNSAACRSTCPHAASRK